MTWLTSNELRPGAELFRSDRRFQFYSFSVSHSQLLLRSGPDDAHATTIEIMLKPVDALRLRGSYDGLVLRVAEPEAAEQVWADLPDLYHGDARVVEMVSAGRADYVVCMAVGWTEGSCRGCR